MPDRVALVTGGSRGIGRAVCVALARQGRPVAVNYRSHADEAKETLSLVQQAGAEGIVVQADVSDRDDVDAMIGLVEDGLGPLAILVNNAGIRSDGLVARMGDEAWADVLATNLTGAFLCTRRALRPMIRHSWGRIV